jgi:hypothetical protein
MGEGHFAQNGCLPGARPEALLAIVPRFHTFLPSRPTKLIDLACRHSKNQQADEFWGPELAFKSPEIVLGISVLIEVV